eukprot:gene2984-8620_t
MKSTITFVLLFCSSTVLAQLAPSIESDGDDIVLRASGGDVKFVTQTGGATSLQELIDVIQKMKQQVAEGDNSTANVDTAMLEIRRVQSELQDSIDAAANNAAQTTAEARATLNSRVDTLVEDMTLSKSAMDGTMEDFAQNIKVLQDHVEGVVTCAKDGRVHDGDDCIAAVSTCEMLSAPKDGGGGGGAAAEGMPTDEQCSRITQLNVQFKAVVDKELGKSEVVNLSGPVGDKVLHLDNDIAEKKSESGYENTWTKRGGPRLLIKETAGVLSLVLKGANKSDEGGGDSSKQLYMNLSLKGVNDGALKRDGKKDITFIAVPNPPLHLKCAVCDRSHTNAKASNDCEFNCFSASGCTAEESDKTTGAKGQKPKAQPHRLRFKNGEIADEFMAKVKAMAK